MFLDHVGLSVGDLDTQADWYCRALGLYKTMPFEIPPLGVRGVFVKNDDGITIELLERQSSRPGLQAPDPATALLTRGFGHIAVRVSDIHKTYADFIAAGATSRMEPQPSPESGVNMAFVADPEGNLVEIIDRSGPVGS